MLKSKLLNHHCLGWGLCATLVSSGPGRTKALSYRSCAAFQLGQKALWGTIIPIYQVHSAKTDYWSVSPRCLWALRQPEHESLVMPQVEVFLRPNNLPARTETVSDKQKVQRLGLPGATVLSFPAPTLTLKHSVKNDQVKIERNPCASWAPQWWETSLGVLAYFMLISDLGCTLSF